MPEVIRDIESTVEIVRPFPWLYLGVSLLILAVILSVFWLYRKRNKKPVLKKQPPPTPPGQEALVALGVLDFKEIKQFYTELSKIVRIFIERRFDLHAPEQTTDEFLIIASQSTLLNDNYRHILSLFLREADMIKFAKHKVSPSHAQDLLTKLSDFIKESQNDDEFMQAFYAKRDSDV